MRCFRDCIDQMLQSHSVKFDDGLHKIKRSSTTLRIAAGLKLRRQLLDRSSDVHSSVDPSPIHAVVQQSIHRAQQLARQRHPGHMPMFPALQPLEIFLRRRRTAHRGAPLPP